MPPRPAAGKGGAGSSFVRNKLAKKGQTSQTKKEHGYDARNYHQNANRVGIHALTMFQCPVCGCKNTVRVFPDKKAGTAVVKCSYCMSLDPMPEDLPYPYVTVFRQKEVVADAFFRFDNAYRKLLVQQEGDLGGPVGMATAHSVGGETHTGTAPSSSSGLIGHLLDASYDSADEEGEANNGNDDDGDDEGDSGAPEGGDAPVPPQPESAEVAESGEKQQADKDVVSDLDDFFNDSD